MQMVEHERSLVKRLQNRPFALLGVNADESRDVLKKLQEKHEINWRSWWDGKHGGPIVAKFRIEGFPTFFFLDTEGVIRKVIPGAPLGDPKEIDNLVEQ